MGDTGRGCSHEVKRKKEGTCYLVTKKSQSRFLGFGPSLELARSDKASVHLQHVSLNSQEDIKRLSNPAFSSLSLLAPQPPQPRLPVFKYSLLWFNQPNIPGLSCSRIYNGSPLPLSRASPNPRLCIEALQALASPLLSQPHPHSRPKHSLAHFCLGVFAHPVSLPGMSLLFLSISPHSTHSSKSTPSPLTSLRPLEGTWLNTGQ